MHLRTRSLVALVALVATACGDIIELEPGNPIEFVQQPQTSRVLAADGSVLVELHAEQDREDVALAEVGQRLVQAIVSLEDRRFFLHAGVDVPAIVRAAVANVESGQIEQGGSTITQQYVKNTMTGPARTLQRKLEEAALAYQLEQRYSKEQILERYLNTIYFGHGAYGVHAAAARYFGKRPGDLALDEATLLAGLIASPSSYDPYDRPEAALDRRRIVLDAMVDAGQISGEEADEAAGTELELAPRERDERVPAPYVVDEVKRLIQHDPDGRFAELLGGTLDERVAALFTGGLRVHTTLDPATQAQAEEAVTSVLTDPGDPDAALVALDPASGAIRALVGGKDYYDAQAPQARFNLATQGKRQPGSAFKPIMLAAALERGVKLDRVFPGGTCVEFAPSVDWKACNYGQTAYGPLTLREATVSSVNTVYARLVVELGALTLTRMARTMGFHQQGWNEAAPANVLGALDVTPLEMAGAYSVFANLGRYREPYLIERIETAAGELLYQHPGTEYQVLDPAVGYLVNQTLQDVVRRGTGVRAQIGRPQAGKTGTGQANRDAWFVGYTPDLVAAVWVGFAEGQIEMVPPTTRVTVEGGRWPAEIWRTFAEQALDGVPESDFPVPDIDLVRVEVDATRNCLPNPYTPQDLIEVREYLSGTAPTERCTEPTGPPIDDVPAVGGLPLAVAKRLLEDRGFVVEIRPEASKLYPPGIITRQRPSPGGNTLASDGNAVVLWVAISTRVRKEVPSVLGLQVEAAITSLEADGWVVEWWLRCPPEGCPEHAPPGVVHHQDPGPGALDREHTAIVIHAYPRR
ncbi:MAG TPA: PBP1A family penicillin-binding protein [Nitriliruptorales bacterium]